MLEERAVPAGATFTVTQLGDTGTGKGTSGDFRYCLEQANSTLGHATIVFSVSGTVDLLSALPEVCNDIDIVGLGAQATVLERATGAPAFGILAIAPETPVTLSGLTIAGGNAVEGAGILNQGSLAVSDCLIEDNVATGAQTGGAGILNDNGSLQLQHSLLLDNQATGSNSLGGGLFNRFGGAVVVGVTLEGNSASLGGGALVETDAVNTSFTNCTFADNVAVSDGGALYLLADEGTTTVALAHCTVVGNTAAALGGVRVFASNGGTATLFFEDSLFASNQHGNFGAAQQVSTSSVATLQSEGYNLSDDATFAPAANDLTSTSPLLGPLENNGDPLVPTFALLPGSPGLDAAMPTSLSHVTVDERGVARPQGSAPDIGAFELGPLQYNVSGQFQDAAAGQPFSTPVSVQVVEGGRPLAGVLVTFTVTPGAVSATFPGGVSQVVVTTDSQGNAFAPTLTAGTVAPPFGSSFTVLAAAGADPNPAVVTLFVVPGPVAGYVLGAPQNVSPGDSFSLSVTPVDQYGNPTFNGLGTLTFQSSDPQAVLPSPFTFSEGEANSPTVEITGLRLNTSGTQTVGLTDQNGVRPTPASVAVADLPARNLQLTRSGGATLAEGEPFTLSGTFADPSGPQEQHQVSVDWGDGTTTTFALAAGVSSFAVDHVYTQGLPSASITASVSDAGGTTTAVQGVTVVNVAPTVQPGLDDFANVGTLFTHPVTIADPGTGPLEVTVDYGDGTKTTFPSTPGPFLLSHLYTAEGSFFVTITADDGQGKPDTEQFRVDVLLAGVHVKTRVETIAPGEEDSISVPGGTLDLIHAKDSPDNAVILVAVVPPGVADALRNGLIDTGTTDDAFDIRAINIGPDDSATATLFFDGPTGKTPTLLYFDRSTGEDERVPADYFEVNTALRRITLHLSRFSTPRLQDLDGTVFTISIPQDIAATSVTSSVPTLDALTVTALMTTTTQAGPGLPGTQGQASSPGLQLANSTTAASAGLGITGGDVALAASVSFSDSGPLGELPPAPASLIMLPTVTVSPSRVPGPSLTTTVPDQGRHQEEAPPEEQAPEDEPGADSVPAAGPPGSPGAPTANVTVGADAVFERLGRRYTAGGGHATDESRVDPTLASVVLALVLGGLEVPAASRRRKTG
jgi:hypothetical protein